MRLSKDGVGAGWATVEFATVAEGRSTVRGQARRAEASDASTVPKLQGLGHYLVSMAR